MAVNKKTGPRAKYIQYGGGKIEGNESIGIGGLSKDKFTHQFYFYYTDPNTGKRKREVLSKDIDKAVKQYQSFKEKLIGQKSVKFFLPNEMKTFAGLITVKPSSEVNKILESKGYSNEDVAKLYEQLLGEITLRETSFVENLVWDKARELIIRDPVLAAKKIGIQELAYLDDLKPKEKSLPLDFIKNLYLNRKEGFTGYERKYSKRCWKEFIDIVKVYPYPLSRQNFEVFKIDSSPFVTAVGTEGARRATGVPTAPRYTSAGVL
jgi:hypothetical protein